MDKVAEMANRLGVHSITPDREYGLSITLGAYEVSPLEMASRYLGPELGAWYAEHNPSSAESVTVTLRPEHWRTHDFGKDLG